MFQSDRDISQWDAKLKEQLERSFHNYQVHTVDLSIARDKEKYDWTGETIIVEKVSSATAIATVRLMFDDADELILEKNVEIKSIFNKVYLSNEVQAGGWLIIIVGINFEYKKKIAEAGGGGLTWVNRGDPDTWDWEWAAEGGDFIMDWYWHDLDMSAVVPPGAVLVLFVLHLTASAAGNLIRFRKKGQVNSNNISERITQVATVPQSFDVWVMPDDNAVIQYLGAATNWSVIDITVRGWFI